MTFYQVVTKSGPPPALRGSTFVETEEEALEQAQKWIKDMIPGSVVTVECYEEEGA